MSNQNRFLLPAATSSASAASSSQASASLQQQHQSASRTTSSSNQDQNENQENQLSVDTDFDSYWEEEARNPHRNRIRIGRQYQATVPPLLKPDEKDRRKLEELETLSFCPKRSARISDAELDHYFTVAKSLNLFASLVETRSLLGRDVTIADLNHIRRKEGLSLASVIQPARQQAPVAAVAVSQNTANASLQSAQQQSNSSASPQKSPPAATNTGSDKSSSSAASPRENLASMNQLLMKALSHFISLHHPCHHGPNCKKLQRDVPAFEDEDRPIVSITAGNLRQAGLTISGRDSKPGRSRSSLKQAQQAIVESQDHQQQQDEQQLQSGSDSAQSPSIEDWTREEIELFSKAIEVCGKNFSSIKKEFLPSKSVKSIVEYYYIGSRDLSDNKKKPNQAIDTPGDTCSSPEKTATNNNSQGGGSGGGGGGGGSSTSVTGKSGVVASSANVPTSSASSSSSRNSANTTDSNTANQNNPVDASGETHEVSVKSEPRVKNEHYTKQYDSDSAANNLINGAQSLVSKNIDARMSVYNFDDEFKEESPVQVECPKPGTEVRPLKAKPIIPNAAAESDSNNSNVGSLKFFMDGQLVLKLNACQDQQEGAEKCHWVQSGERHVNANRQKRYTKKSEKNPDASQNGSQSNSVVSSYQDDDSKNDDLSGDEDSKESMNSFSNSPQARASSQPSPNSKRLKVTTVADPNLAQTPHLPSPVDYNRLALQNRIKERNDSINRSNSSAISQAMPWLQANSFAMAAALLGGLPFPASANMIQEAQQNINSNNNSSTSNNTLNSKPMDLSIEHHSPPKALPKSTSRSRSRSKNN